MENKRYNTFQRDSQTAERYGKDWRKIRKTFIDEHPFCENCLKKGLIVQSSMVHHIKPVRDGGTNAEENLMALCKSCHSRLHAQNGERWGK